MSNGIAQREYNHKSRIVNVNKKTNYRKHNEIEHEVKENISIAIRSLFWFNKMNRRIND